MVFSRNFFRFISRSSKQLKEYEVVFPENVSMQKSFDSLPKNISIPPYAQTGIPPEMSPNMKPEVKSHEDIAKMRKSCHLARNVLQEASKLVKPGVTTQMIDEFVFQMSVENGAYPSPLNYKGFPKSACTSVNNVACHGIPDSRALVDGDIINIDITVYLVSSYFYYYLKRAIFHNHLLNCMQKFIILYFRTVSMVIVQKLFQWGKLMKTPKN